jgi:hypothetical protein
MSASPQHCELADFALVPIPARAGIGLKPEHYKQVLDQRPDIGWLEVHPENYMGDGGAPHFYLTSIRELYPLSLHGVGLSIGSASDLDHGHLRRLKTLVDRYQPGLLSEHLAWSTHEGVYFNDLLPLPYTQETLDLVVRHVDQVQGFVGRRMLLENPSTYVSFDDSELSEIAFLDGVARRTGCGLLLDVNNVYVSAVNHGFDANYYIDAFPAEHVGEVHLAGHAEVQDDAGQSLLIDAHDRNVRSEVWALYRRAVARIGPVPTLIEWDNDIPALEVLIDESRRAERVMAERRSNHAQHR